MLNVHFLPSKIVLNILLMFMVKSFYVDFYNFIEVYKGLISTV